VIVESGLSDRLASVPLVAGASIGPYTISRELGRGGMGVVYLGRDTRLGRSVAIKSLPEDFANDSQRLARFEREARAIAQVNHPNVAGIYGVEECDGHRLLVLECVEGETLADRLERGALPVDEAIDICAQIAAGVEAAHEAGIVHRDLKPGNVKITPGGQVKVLDFGLAKSGSEAALSGSNISQSPTISSPSPRHSPTIPGAILGTAAYMSPEQARGLGIDKRTDIWSLGVILFECLTGAGPFLGETASDSIGAILHKPIDFSALPPGTPPMVRHVLERCLERDRSKRYRDIGDVRIELAAAATGSQGGLGAGRPGRGRNLWVGGIGALIVVAAGAGTVGLLAGRGSPPAQAESTRRRFEIPLLSTRTYSAGRPSSRRPRRRSRSSGAPNGRGMIASSTAPAMRESQWFRRAAA